MLKKIAIICGAFLALFPCAVKADIDPSTIIQDKLVIVNEEMNKILKAKTGFELNLQELVNNRKAFEAKIKNGIKAYAIDKAMELGSKVKIKQVTLSGIGAKIKGDRSNPELEKALGKKITRKKQQNEDIKKTKEQLELVNNMQVENVAVMYANALVVRRAVIDEGKNLEEEEQTEMSDIPTITNAYKAVTLRADGRWMEILKAKSAYYKQLANIELVNLRVNEDEEDKETENKSGEDDASGQDNQNNSSAANDNSGMSLTDIYEKGKNTYDNASSGNYGAALGNVVDGTANAMGDNLDDKTKNILSGASSGLNAADRVSDSIDNGDWRSAVSGAVSGAGEAASKGLGGGMGSNVANDAAHNVNAGINATTNAVNNFGNGNTVDGIMDIFDGMSNLQDTTGKD